MVGKIGARKKFYSAWSILERLFGNLDHAAIFLAMNWGHVKGVRAEERRLAVIRKELYDRLA